MIESGIILILSLLLTWFVYYMIAKSDREGCTGYHLWRREDEQLEKQGGEYADS